MKRLETGNFVGVSPAGVSWVCYWDDDSMFQRMRQVLASHWKRYNERRSEKIVKVSRITELQMEWIEEELWSWTQSDSNLDANTTVRKTVVQAPRYFFQGVLERLEGELDRNGCLLDPGLADTMRCKTDAEVDFAIRSKERSIKSLMRKLRRAL